MRKYTLLYLFTLIYCSSCYGQFELRALNEMQKRVWISQSDLTTLLLAVGTPKCLRPCISGLVAATSEALKFNDSIVTGIENLCREYKKARECVSTSKCGRNSTAFAVFTKGLEAACGENFHLIYFVKPCLEQHAETALRACDEDCELSVEVDKLTNSKHITKLANRGGNAITLLRHLGPTCSSMICFLSCAHKGLNHKCPLTGNAFVEVTLKPLEDVAEKVKTASPGLKKMIKKKLPRHCQPLLDADYLSKLRAFGSIPTKEKYVAIKVVVDRPPFSALQQRRFYSVEW